MIKKPLILLGKPFYFCVQYGLVLGIILRYLPQSIKVHLNLLFSNLSRKKYWAKLPKLHNTLKLLTRFKRVKLPALNLDQLRNFKLKKLSLVKKNSRKNVVKNKKISLKHFLQFSLVLLSLLIVVLAGSFHYLSKDLPNPESLSTRKQSLSTKIYDRNGNLLYKIYKDENRSLIKLSELPPHVIQATIAIEDAEFYSHHGLSYRGITRALRRNIFEDKKMEGGSTITQQLIKNALLTPERTLVRKLKEIILALRVESLYSKEEILQMYFNEVGYGGTAYGIEEASHYYFNKSAKDLDLAQAALLAGLPASPSIFSPFGSYPEIARERQELVLRRMREEGYISKEEAQKARSEPLTYAEHKIDIKAPHFVFFIKDLLIEKYGEDMVNRGGLEVKTSLDLDIQELAQVSLTQELEKVKSLKISNGAVLVTRPKTGEILAMVGSIDYFDLKHDGQVNVTTRPRQPGSSIKPINYALALSNGLTPATIIMDVPTTFKIPGLPPYSPKNYDNKFHGRVTLREALANSYNIPAVKVLSKMGVSNMIDLGRKMGIESWGSPDQYGLSLTLGGGEVTMTELATAYGVFANEGDRVDLSPILWVQDHKGKTLEQFDCPGYEDDLNQNQTRDASCKVKSVLSKEVSYQINSILSDNKARTPAFGSYSTLFIPNQEVAVKTGTTNNLRDNWTIGYTSEYLVASWVGNNDNTPMKSVASGITGASPIWNRVMSSLLREQKISHKFPRPEGLIESKVCKNKSQNTSNFPCSNTVTEYFAPGTEPRTNLERKFRLQPEQRL